MESKRIKSALVSVFYKDGLEDIVRALDAQGVTIYSTGGTQKFIEELGIKPVRWRVSRDTPPSSAVV